MLSVLMKRVSGQAEIAETCVYDCQTSVASCIFQSVMLVSCKLQLFPLLSMWGQCKGHSDVSIPNTQTLYTSEGLVAIHTRQNQRLEGS